MSEKNPWKTVSTKVVYENPWISVREDQVICPDGSPGIYGVVDCRIATGVVALTNDSHIYLVGQYRYPLDRYSWEIIEGGAETGETALEAAQRELVEEAGIIAKNWTPLGPEIHLSNCHSSESGNLFLARELSFTQSKPDHTEVLQIKKVSLKEAFSMLSSGEISDSLTIIALSRLKDIALTR